MLDSHLDGLSAGKTGVPCMEGQDRRTTFGRTVPAFLAPVIWMRVKESLMFSGVFPSEAELEVQEDAGDTVVINCSWPLLDGPLRPDRRSVPIRILIHGDLADQFHNAAPEIFRQLNEALARVIARRMKRYQPDLGQPYHRPSPPFEMRIGLGHIGWVGPGGKQEAA